MDRRAERAAPERSVGLDGLRAVAVVAVVVYHLDPGAMPGGFLGVDVFFVLSGYLITGLLIAEWRRRGSVDLAAFWRRRARRLFPPLVLVLGGVALVMSSVYADVVRRVRGELVAAVAQSGNWFQAFAGHSYFEATGRPTPLLHLWSLGVEAQFYALWPLVAVVALRRRGVASVRTLAVVGAVASFAAMALLYQPGQDPSRLYYGTDTRAGTLLVGAVLATAWPAHRLRRSIPTGARVLVDVAGLVGLAGLGALALQLHGTSPLAYRGGLALAAVLATLVVAATVHPGGDLGRVLSLRPLVWLGTRSYAVYLWHWPVITATRPGTDVAINGVALLALRVGATLVLAEASTRLVEVALRPAWRPGVVGARRIVGATAAALVLAVAMATASPASTPVFFVSPTTSLATAGPVAAPIASAPRPARPARDTTPAPEASTTTAAAAPELTAPTQPPAAVTTSPEEAAAPSPATTATPATVVAPPEVAAAAAAPSEQGRTVAVGESVLLAAGGEVQRALGPGTIVDAAVSRQPSDVLDALEAARRDGRLEGVDTIVVHMGSNGVLREDDMERLAALAVGSRRVVGVTVRVDRPWQEPSNATLQAAADRHPWLRLADWHGLASANPQWLVADGIHPNQEGARQYAALVAETVHAP